MAAILRAVRGPNARDEIMVATMLLTSRTPFRKPNTRARVMTRMSSGDMVIHVVAKSVSCDDAISDQQKNSRD
jgi:hypothetical protein